MMCARWACVGVVASVAVSMASAQSVEFRIVEMTDKATADPANPELNFAIQARVTSPSNAFGLSSFVCAMLALGEPENFGTLSRLRTSNPDWTYFDGLSTSGGGGGSAGLAKQYSYLSNVNSAFNGVINTSSGSWTQTPHQDIGLIFGASRDSTFLNVPGVDADADGTPDTAVGNSAVLSPAVLGDYFGAGKFIDIYRFRYRVTDFTPRTIDFSIIGDTTLPTPQVYIGSYAAQSTSGSWLLAQEQQLILSPSALQGFSVQVLPAPTSAALLGGLAGIASLRRRR